MSAADLTLQWIDDADERRQAAIFFARVIALDTAYISHGEIQAALSPDGKSWAPDLEARFVADLSSADKARAVALARSGEDLVGAAIVRWRMERDEAPFGVIEDIAVEPGRRGQGAGQALAAFIEAEARARNIRWLFLESGKDNRGAHAFFERLGYTPLSTVFGKRL